MLRRTLPFSEAVVPEALQWFLIAGVLVLLLGMILLLYRYESKLVPPWSARLMLGLRMLVIAGLWLLVSLKPFVEHTTTEELQGRILLAIDRSDSMTLTDGQRTLLEKLRLAKALKLFDGICTAAELDEFIKQAEAGKEPNSAAVAALSREIDGLTRAQIVERLLLGDSTELLKKLSAKHRLQVMTFARNSADAPSKPEDLKKLLSSAGPPPGGGTATDLEQPLTVALGRAGSEAGKLLGLVLLTDARHNQAGDVVAKAGELAARQVPVLPVVIGSSIVPTDVAIGAVRTNARAFKGVATPIDATIEIRNLPIPAGQKTRPIVVTLHWPEIPGKPTPEPMTATIQYDGKTTTYALPEAFRPRLDESRDYVFTLRVENVPEDRFPENNERKVLVSVGNDKAKVLLVDGEARWEFHYLASLLARDPKMELKTVVFSQPRLNRIAEEDLVRMGYPLRQLPSEPNALSQYDAIILGDVTPDQLSRQDRERIEKYVAERGGTLVMLAGKRAMPMAYVADAANPNREKDPIAKLLPIRDPQIVDSHQGFTLEVSKEGEQAWYLNMKDEESESKERWASLRKQHWAVVGPPSPAAQVLMIAQVPEEDRPVIKGQTAKEEATTAVFLTQKYGFGTVAYIGIDSTWRWRFKKGDEYHHRFWSQLITWAASDKVLPAKNPSETIHFGTRDPLYQEGDNVEMLARLSEQIHVPAADDPLKAILYRKKQPAGGEKEGQEVWERVRTVPLSQSKARMNELNASLRDLPAGQYQLELENEELNDQLYETPMGGSPRKVRASFEIQPGDNPERRQLGADWELAAKLAAPGQGSVYTPETIEELVQKINTLTTTREVKTETRLWESWWTLLLLVGLLTVEWVTRKLVGLP